MNAINKMVVVLTGALSGFLSFSGPATACCSPSPVGQPVAFGDQSNIIIWNAKTKTEHFVRKANFESSAKDFGFIAPTPSKPELSEASEKAFDTLAALRPPTKREAKGLTLLYGAPVAAGLVVVQEVDVAGYHATTLLAEDAKGLSAWLQSNGYASTPETEKWTKVYIAKHWYLTAFKVSNAAQVATTGTIRMSFKTGQPFNPFYVPKDNIVPGKKGTLRVFFVADGDYQATVGHAGTWKKRSWQAPMPANSVKSLAEQLKLPSVEIPKNAGVAMFVDADFPRAAADDIYFSRK